MTKIPLLFAITLIWPWMLLGQERLGPIFQDHMVLQRGQAVPVWGTAATGTKVTVTFGDKTVNTTATQDHWQIMLPSLAVNATGQILTATFSPQQRETTTQQCQDVLVGDVIFAGGQSNMGGGLDRLRGNAVRPDDPLLRVYRISPRKEERGNMVNSAGLPAMPFCTQSKVTPVE